MDAVTFEDVLSHYSNILQLAYEELDGIKTPMREAMEITETSWRGPSATACFTKLEEINICLERTKTELSDAMLKLSAIEVISPEAEG